MRTSQITIAFSSDRRLRVFRVELGRKHLDEIGRSVASCQLAQWRIIIGDDGEQVIPESFFRCRTRRWILDLPCFPEHELQCLVGQIAGGACCCLRWDVTRHGQRLKAQSSQVSPDLRPTPVLWVVSCPFQLYDALCCSTGQPKLRALSGPGSPMGSGIPGTASVTGAPERSLALMWKIFRYATR